MRHQHLKFGFLAICFAAAPAFAEAGEALQGVAQILAAGAPMGMAAAEAAAAKAIAKENARATLATTEIQAETSKELAGIQAEVALAQTAASAEINGLNQFFATLRLAMQLQEVRAAREEASKAQREKRQYEYQLTQEKVESAKEAAKLQNEKEKLSLQAQLVQAGLTTGFRYQDSSRGVQATPSGLLSLISGSTPSQRLRIAESPNSDLKAFRQALAQLEPSHWQPNRESLRGSTQPQQAQPLWVARSIFNRKPAAFRGAHSGNAASRLGRTR